MRGGRVQRLCDPFVGARGRDREMAGVLLDVDIQPCEPAVEPTPLVQRHRRVAGRGEQRMCEAYAVAVELDHALSHGQFEVIDRRGRQGFKQRHRRSCQRGDRDERLAYPRRQRAQPSLNEGAQALG